MISQFYTLFEIYAEHAIDEKFEKKKTRKDDGGPL